MLAILILVKICRLTLSAVRGCAARLPGDAYGREGERCGWLHSTAQRTTPAWVCSRMVATTRAAWLLCPVRHSFERTERTTSVPALWRHIGGRHRLWRHHPWCHRWCHVTPQPSSLGRHVTALWRRHAGRHCVEIWRLG
jgi:hypothetical protein